MKKRYEVCFDSVYGCLAIVEVEATSSQNARDEARKYMEPGETIEYVDCLDDEED